MVDVEIEIWFKPVWFLWFRQCINYKNIGLHYTFAILQSNWSVVWGKKTFNVYILERLLSIFCEQYGQNKGKTFFTIIFFSNALHLWFNNTVTVKAFVWYLCITGSLITPFRRYIHGGSTAPASSHSTEIKVCDICSITIINIFRIAALKKTMCFVSFLCSASTLVQPLSKCAVQNVWHLFPLVNSDRERVTLKGRTQQ